MASEVPYNLSYLALKGDIDFDTSTFYVILLDNTHTPSPDNDTYSDISGDEIATGGGYTKGTGVAAPTLTVGVDAGSDECRVTAGSTTTFSSVTLADVRYAAIVKCTAGSGSLQTTDPVISVNDLQADQNPTGGDLVITWPTTGILAYTH